MKKSTAKVVAVGFMLVAFVFLFREDVAAVAVCVSFAALAMATRKQ